MFDEHAHQTSIGKSRFYMHRALLEAGFPSILPNTTYQYRSYGLLLRIGYTEINKPSYFVKGDITVTENNDSHPDGHIAMWNGKQWVSDFFQKSEFIYSYNQPWVHYFRIFLGNNNNENIINGCDGKTINQIAMEVIQGKWGTEEERIKKLNDVGCDHNIIQNELDRILGLN